jgi:hypothetical protein
MMNSDLMANEAQKAIEREQSAIADRLDNASIASQHRHIPQQTPVVDAIAAESTENMVLKYIKLLTPEDKYLLDFQKIYDTGNLYISNYKSELYQEYKNMFKIFMSKYYNPKKYKVTSDNQKLTAYRRNNDGTYEDTPVNTLEKYHFLNSGDIVKNSYKALAQMRNRLTHEYNNILKQPYVDIAIKSKFIKRRDYMIKLLNEYYTISYYHNKINNIITANENIVLSRSSEYYSESRNELLPRLEPSTINVAPEIITLLNENSSQKLELYNQIKALMTSNTDKSEIKKAIANYIKFDSNNEQLNSKIQRKLNKITIDTLVVFPGQDLPEFYTRMRSGQQNSIKRFYFNKKSSN